MGKSRKVSFLGNRKPSRGLRFQDPSPCCVVDVLQEFMICPLRKFQILLFIFRGQKNLVVQRVIWQIPYQTGGLLLPNGRAIATKGAAVSYRTGGDWILPPALSVRFTTKRATAPASALDLCLLVPFVIKIDGTYIGSLPNGRRANGVPYQTGDAMWMVLACM